MGHNCCSKEKVKRGLWSPEEDEKLIKYISIHGHVSWSSVPKLAGLERCGKSCRLRWINYLRPDVKRGAFTPQEERTIIRIHRILGNRWAQIAKHLPGRTDNEVKNFWNSSIKKKLVAQGLDPNAHYLLSSPPLQPPQSCHTASNIINNNINYNNNSTCQQITRNPGSVFTLVSQEMKDTCNSVETKTPSIPPPPFPPCHISPTFLPALECQSCTNIKGFLESTSSSWGSKSLDGIDEMQRARGVLEIHKAEYVSSSDTMTGTAVGRENHIDAFSFESFDLDFDSMESTTAAATLLPSPRPFGVHCDATSTVDQLSWEYSWPYI